MSQPKIWKAKDGSVTEIDTPYNIRARELKDIYNSLNMNFLTQDERLDVLLTLKHTVKVNIAKIPILIKMSKIVLFSINYFYWKLGKNSHCNEIWCNIYS